MLSPLHKARACTLLTTQTFRDINPTNTNTNIAKQSATKENYNDRTANTPISSNSNRKNSFTHSLHPLRISYLSILSHYRDSSSSSSSSSSIDFSLQCFGPFFAKKKIYCDISVVVNSYNFWLILFVFEYLGHNFSPKMGGG